MKNAVPFALPALLVLAVGEVELVHAPAVGASRSISFTAETNLEGGSLEVEMDGSPVPSEYLPDLELTMVDRRAVVCEETNERADGSAWMRRYDDVSWENEGAMSMKMGDSEQSFPWTVDAETPVQGRTVRFDGADGEFDREAADGGDADVLEGLCADLSLAALLPDSSIDVGESWSADGEGLGLLFDPIGDAGWVLPAEAAEHMLPEILERSHGGELELTLRSVDGALARCSVEGKLTRTTLQPGDLSQVPVVDGDATDTVEEAWSCSGELVWDLERGQIASLNLSGELSSSTLTERDPGQPGSTYESTFLVTGTHVVSVESEALEGRAVEASATR